MAESPVQQIKDKLDIVEVVQSYLKLQKTGANYRALCPFHSEKKPSFFVSPTRQIWRCFGCFPKNSLIKTENGFHKIEDIQVGENVLTHQGKFMPVIRTLWRPYNGEIIDIKVRKSNEVTSLTSDHKVYVIKTKNCIHKGRLTRICQWRCNKVYCPRFYLDYKIEKVAASELSINDYLLYPINQEVKDVEFIDLEKYYNRRISNLGFEIGEIPTKIKVDEKFLKLIGYYITEGSNHRAYIRFSLGGHEEAFAKEIKTLTKEIFGIKAGIYKRRKGKTGIEVSACNSKLSNIFENLCGKGAENKHIPLKFQYLPPEKQRILLDAIFKGDGHFAKVSKCRKERKAKVIATTSLLLMEQLRDILLRLGKPPTIGIEEEKVDKKNVHHKKYYEIQWQEDYLAHYSDFYRDSKSGILYWISPIKEIKRRQFQGNVYNLTVAEAHSYMATNFVVGNCGEGGDIFRFVMKIEGVEFGDALRILARKAGVELKPFRPELKTQRQRLYEISEWACRFFEKQLEGSGAGQEAKNYLLKRGLQEKSIKKWRLGYSPDKWRALSDFLVGKGYKREEIVKAGLAIKSEKSQSPYDRFRGRIIFPIFDLNSQVIGFGGRVFKKAQDDEPAKYINIPNTLIYDKSRILYGLNFAKVAVRKKDACILAEGYTDVIFAHQAGYENTIASSGTALTWQQLKILKRYTSNLLTAFDMDVAGDLATKKGIDLAQRQDFEVKVIKMPRDSDPADIIAKSVERWKNLVERAKEIVNFYFENALDKFDRTTAQGKKEISRILLPKIKQIPNKISQAHWIQKLSKMLTVPEEAITEELKKIIKREETPEIPQPEPEVQPPPAKKEKSRQEVLEERILSLILKSPQNLKLIEEDSLPVFCPQLKVILATLKKEKVIEQGEMEKILQKLEKEDKELKEILDTCSLRAEIEEVTDPTQEIELCLSQLNQLAAKKRLTEISQAIQSAEEKKDGKRVKALMEKFNQLTKKLNAQEKT